MLKKCIRLTINIYINCKENEYNKLFYKLFSVRTFRIFFLCLFETVGKVSSNG